MTRTTVVVGALMVAACGAPAATTAPVSPARTAFVPTPAPSPPAEPPLPPPLPGQPYLSSARLAAVLDGVIAIDEDSGTLARTDANGKVIAKVAIAPRAGELVYDPARSVAFVADRMNDRIAVVNVTDKLAVVAQWKTPVEPFGVALTPDRTTLLVTTIADRTLVALDAQTGEEKWRAAISSEARGIAVSPDGTRALVSSMRVGGLDEIALGSHAVSQLAFDLTCDDCVPGPAFARGNGAVTFLDAYRAVAPFTRAVPDAGVSFAVERYGGSMQTPITQHIAFLTFTQKTGQVAGEVRVHQPRSMAWDAHGDTLYVGGLGSDSFLVLPNLTHASTAETESRAADQFVATKDRCGVDGLVVGIDSVYAWCSFTRTVVRVDTAAVSQAIPTVEGTAVAASRLSKAQHDGFELFYRTNPSINHARAMTCSTCHIDGRTDGVSWKIHELTLQTPILAGRLKATAPYKWNAESPTLARSIEATILRLGGRGLETKEMQALVAYVEQLPAPRAPTLDRDAVMRGRAVFSATGCSECHSGKLYTDRETHAFGSALANADTPSLVGLSASAPYYHDGSAETLEALVRGQGSVHGMASFETLEDAQRADLVAFLSSL
ncbi:MAG TPA: c-type cytochrome [Kofleriaceae bacterium]